MLYFSLQDRSSDEVSESKRRKESPDAPTLTKETEAAKEKKRLVKVSKKESNKTGVDTTPAPTKRVKMSPKMFTRLAIACQ